MKCFTNWRISLFCITLLLITKPVAAAGEPAAELARIAENYRALKAYADTGQSRLVSSTGKPGEPQQAQTEFARPARLKITADDIRLAIADGKSTTVLDTLRTTRTETTAKEKLPQADELLVGPLGAALLGSPLGQPQAILLHLLLDPKADAWLAREGAPASLPAQDFAGKTWNRLKLDRPLRPDWIIWYDPKSALIGRLEVVAGDPSKPAVGVSWESGPIRTEALPNAAWSLDVPAGYESVDQKVAAFQKAAAEKKKKPDSSLVGKPVPDFPIEIIAADGKTRAGKLSDFKGKPILIDIWATWCGPCRKSMPELTQTLATLDDKSDLQTILLSIDQKPEEGTLADHVRLGLKKMGVEIENLPRATLALDKTGAGAKALNAEAIPMTIIIDKAGLVKFVHVGITPATTLRKDLAELK